MEKNLKPKDIVMCSLNGAAHAIVIALVPFAILGTILKLFPDNSFAQEFLTIVRFFQVFTALFTGVLAANYAGLNPMQSAAVGGACMVASGGWRNIDVLYNGEEINIFQMMGAGDVINTMITAGLAIVLVMKVAHKFGPFNIILLPIVIGALMGYVGYKLLPFVSSITAFIGNIINTFTNLQPAVMCILLAIAFGILTLSPISTTAIAMATSLTGMAAGAAAMGVATAGVFLTVVTFKNKKTSNGVPLAIFIGAMKMMMPNFVRAPIMALPVAISAALNAIPVIIWQIVNETNTAGFGLAGLIAPISSVETGNLPIPLVILSWFVIPFITAIAADYLCERVLKLYDNDIFTVQAA